MNTIKYLQQYILAPLNLSVDVWVSDYDSAGYSGCSFSAGATPFLFRKARITPKKNGQFVTIWKRNTHNQQTEPYALEDHYDFYIILTETETQSGFFIFPKQILAEKRILTTPEIPGKRGIRVYPGWDTAGSPLAEKTRNWQKEFFIDISEINYSGKLNTIFQKYSETSANHI